MSAGDADDDGSASRIYVGNLTPKANEVHLKKLFARFGVIHNIWIARKVCLVRSLALHGSTSNAVSFATVLMSRVLLWRVNV